MKLPKDIKTQMKNWGVKTPEQEAKVLERLEKGEPPGIPTEEPNIYYDLNGLDVRVSRRINGKQHFRRKRHVSTLYNARRVRQELIDELGALATKEEGGDLRWEDALSDYIDYMEKRHREGTLAFTTLETACSTIKKHTEKWTKLWLSEITGHMIESLVTNDEIKEKVSIETRANILKYIRGVFKRQIHLGRIKFNPAFGIYVRNKKQRSYPALMSAAEVYRVLAHAEDIESDWFYVYGVAYETGARSGELYALKWQDIDFELRTIKIKRSYCWKSEEEKPTKGMKDRTVSMNANLIKFLKKIKTPPSWSGACSATHPRLEGR